MPKRLDTKRSPTKNAAASQSVVKKHTPWIAMRAARGVITLVSLAMGILVATTAIPQKGWLEGILLSVGFAAGIWVIFLVTYFLQTRLRR